MIVEGEPELEVETDRTPEGESVDDILINVTPSSGIVVEDVALEDIVSKINEAPVSSGTTEIEEEEIIPTQEEPGMLAVDTFANKIKRGLNELGKKVKGMFGKIASMFGGNNDAGNNTSTTSTGGQTQEAKSPKATQTPENGFIQHVDLKFDFLKNANTEGRTDETKPKGVDESTQGYEMDD